MSYSALELANAFIKAGELEDALDALNQHLEQAPDDDEALRLRAEVRARIPGEQNLRMALRDLDSLTPVYPQDAMLRSALLEQLGDRAESLNAIAQGHAANPDDERLAERYLHLLRAQGEITRARVLAEQMRAGQPDSWRWMQWAGDLAVDAGDDLAAIAAYSSALETLDARYGLDSHTSASILDDEAVSDAASLTIPGVYARLLLARGAALGRVEQFERAEADYATAARMIPDDPVIGFNRGLLAARRGDLDAARPLCRAALEVANAALRADMEATLRTDSAYAELASLMTS